MINIYNTTLDWAKKNKLNLHYEKELASTNDFAKQSNSDQDLVLTEFQASGRGRNKNTWLSPKAGHGLLCSFVFNVKNLPQPITTALVGLCLYESLKSSFTDLKWSIKAPNDIWLNDKKIAGILCETLSSGNAHRLIIGLGVNFLSSPNIDSATSLNSDLVTDENYIDFLTSFYSNLKDSLKDFESKKLAQEAQNKLLKALNQCPYYKQNIIKVNDSCDIVFDNKTLNWYSL